MAPQPGYSTAVPGHPERSRLRRLSLYLTVLLVTFLLGFVPMWMQARMQLATTRALQQQLDLVMLENTLAAAALLAGRGEYERAREAVSRFYSALRVQIDHPDSVLAPQQKEGLRVAMSDRDEVNTLLARSDPASADRLATLYVTHRQLLSRASDTPE